MVEQQAERGKNGVGVLGRAAASRLRSWAAQIDWAARWAAQVAYARAERGARAAGGLIRAGVAQPNRAIASP